MSIDKHAAELKTIDICRGFMDTVSATPIQCISIPTFPIPHSNTYCICVNISSTGGAEGATQVEDPDGVSHSLEIHHQEDRGSVNNNNNKQ